MLKQYEDALERHILKLIEDEERDAPEGDYSATDHYAVVYNDNNIVVSFIASPSEFSNPEVEGLNCKYLGKISEDTYDVLTYAEVTRLEAWPTYDPSTNVFGLIKLSVTCDATFSKETNSYISSTGEFNVSFKVVNENGTEDSSRIDGKVYLKNMSFDGVDGLTINGENARKVELDGNTFDVSLSSEEDGNNVVRIKAFISGESTEFSGRWLVKYLSFAKNVPIVEQYRRV
jgi:hypothetical protein